MRQGCDQIGVGIRVKFWCAQVNPLAQSKVAEMIVIVCVPGKRDSRIHDNGLFDTADRKVRDPRNHSTSSSDAMRVAYCNRAQENVLEFWTQLKCIVVQRLYHVEQRTRVSRSDEGLAPSEHMAAMLSMSSGKSRPGRVEID
jgi:hypothetical protein